MIRKGTRFNATKPSEDGTISIVMLNPSAPDNAQVGYIVARVCYATELPLGGGGPVPTPDTVKLGDIIASSLTARFHDEGI